MQSLPRARSIRPTLVALLALLWVTPAGAETAAEVASLAGLAGLQVVVEDLPYEGQASGLEREIMQRNVEERLRHLQVPVVADASRVRSSPRLQVRVRLVKAGPILVYSIAMLLSQEASLERVPGEASRAITWEAVAVGFASRPQEDVPSSLRALSESFARDFQTANTRGALQGARGPGS